MSSLEVVFAANSQEAAYQIGIVIIQAIQNELSHRGSGRFYPIPGNIFYDKTTPKEQRAPNYYVKFTGTHKRDEIMGGAYQASAPGEPPAVRTGRLRQSFYLVVSPTDAGTFEVKVTSSIYYASDLEFGTEKVKPRPFVAPAIQKSLPKIIAIQHDFLYKVLRGQD